MKELKVITKFAVKDSFVKNISVNDQSKDGAKPSCVKQTSDEDL